MSTKPDPTRRAFLASLPAVTAGLATPAVAAEKAAPHWGMLVDTRRCIGCQACTIACSMENVLPEGQFRTTVSTYAVTNGEGKTGLSMVPRLCNHCDEPPCIPVCPVSATFKRKDGVVLVDAERCVGCAYCVQACPYDARFINHHTGKADKCTFCSHRVEAGLLPACVETCVGGARIFGDLNNPESEISRRIKAADGKTSVLKPEAGTKPRVFYIGLSKELDGRVDGNSRRRDDVAPEPTRRMNMSTTVEVFGFTREAGWLPWAVQYFFLIGISTAALFLSLPGMVWRRPQWIGVSRRALLAALVCGLAAPVALLSDLHQPGRFLNFYLHPNLESWMAWGAFFIPLYLFGLLLYAWLCVRPLLDVLARRCAPDTRLAAFYRALAYGGHDNAGAIRVAALIAALGAVLVLLYTGMEVMVVRSRSLWNTPLLPLFFVVTAFAGGLGMTGLFGALSGNTASAALLNRWLKHSQWATLALLAAWLLAGFSGASESAADALAATRGSFGWLLTLAWLVGTTVLALWLAHARPQSLVLPALLALHGTWAVRWVVFMGGQGIPKIGAGFSPHFLTMTPDSVVGIVGTAGLCVALYIALTSFIPWDDPVEA